MTIVEQPSDETAAKSRGAESSGEKSTGELYHYRKREHVSGRILTSEDVANQLPRSWDQRQKVFILFITALVQISMNLNASIFGNAFKDLEQT